MQLELIMSKRIEKYYRISDNSYKLIIVECDNKIENKNS